MRNTLRQSLVAVSLVATVSGALLYRASWPTFKYVNEPLFTMNEESIQYVTDRMSDIGTLCLALQSSGLQVRHELDYEGERIPMESWNYFLNDGLTFITYTTPMYTVDIVTDKNVQLLRIKTESQDSDWCRAESIDSVLLSEVLTVCNQRDKHTEYLRQTFAGLNNYRKHQDLASYVSDNIELAFPSSIGDATETFSAVSIKHTDDVFVVNSYRSGNFEESWVANISNRMPELPELSNVRNDYTKFEEIYYEVNK